MLKLEVSQPLHYLYIIVNMQMLSFLSIVSFIGLNKKKRGEICFIQREHKRSSVKAKRRQTLCLQSGHIFKLQIGFE